MREFSEVMENKINMQKSMTYTHANTNKLQRREWKIPFILATKCDKISRNKYHKKWARGKVYIKHFKTASNDRRLKQVTMKIMFLGKHENTAPKIYQFPYVSLKLGCNCSCVGEAVGKPSLMLLRCWQKFELVSSYRRKFG